eukprot:10174418-Ditylum_brightwellii.AAC.1
MPSTDPHESIATVVNKLVPFALQNQVIFQPVVKNTDNRYSLSTDQKTKESEDTQENDDAFTQKKFNTSNKDILNRAKETYKCLFESKIFPAENIHYSPIFPFIVHETALLSRSRDVWDSIEEMSIKCNIFGDAL